MARTAYSGNQRSKALALAPGYIDSKFQVFIKHRLGPMDSNRLPDDGISFQRVEENIIFAPIGSGQLLDHKAEERAMKFVCINSDTNRSDVCKKKAILSPMRG